MRTKLRSKFTLLFMTCAVLLAVPAIALADDFRNDLDNDFEAAFEVLGLAAGGATDDVNIVLQTQGSDSDGGCNLGDSGDTKSSIEVQAISSNTSAATVKWVATGTDKVNFSGCNAANSHDLRVTSGSAGTANITFAITGATATATPGVYTVSGTGDGTYDVRTAQFTAEVAAPPNNPPDVSVTGVEHGAVYEHGNVPAAGCNVTDDNDTNPTTDPVKDSSGLNSYGLGSETVTCSYTDGGGLEETATATYTIVDTTAPVIADHDPVVAEATGADGATVNYDLPTAEDAVYGSVEVICDPAPGDLFPLGETTVECSATDGSGNTGTNSFTVTVQDTTAPDLTLPDDIIAEATGPGGAPVDFSGDVSASDLVDGNVAVDCDPASGSQFPLGATTVDCTATDAAGNTASGSFDVTVQDTTAPDLTLPNDLTVEATGPGGAPVDFSGDVSASDLVDGNVAVDCDPASGTFPLGTTEVSCSATDAAGNTANGSFNVTVEDTTAPQLSLPANISVFAASNSQATVTYTASATDLVDGSVPVNCSAASGSSFPAGTTTVSCSATDAAGNTANGSFTVTVNYDWAGFFQPIDNNGVLNKVKLGSTVPVKFSLGGNQGLNIFEAGYPQVSKPFACGSNPVVDQVEEYTSATTSGLKYDATANQYIYNWKTTEANPKAGECRQLIVKLKDGSIHRANVNFFK